MNFKPTEAKPETKKPIEVKTVTGCDHEKTETKKEETFEYKMAHTQAKDQWYVGYQDKGKDKAMTWKNFDLNQEKEAREYYEHHKEVKARLLCRNEKVFEKNGDEKMVEEMIKYA